MKMIKCIILTLLLVALFSGAIVLDPLVRFSLDLQSNRFDDAQSVYLSRLSVSNGLQSEAAGLLQRYIDHQLERYYLRELSRDSIMEILTSLANTGLPQKDIDRCLNAVADMESARANLAQAGGFYLQGDYAYAIPLFRQSLIADDTAALRLEEAELRYKSQLLEKAESAIEKKSVEGIEEILMSGLSVLGSDNDLSAALKDVRRIQEDQAYDALEAEARQLMAASGPEAAFQYVADLRQHTPNEYRLEYLEQLLRHDYEEDICTRAMSLLDEGDPSGACFLLEEGLLLLDSQQLKTLCAEIRSTIPVSLKDVCVSKDETANARSGAVSTVTWDQVLHDSFSHEYEHSLYADLGTVSFSLGGAFDLFTGTVAFPLGEKSDIYRETATLQIFGDGRLVGEFKDMDGSSAPISFRIPVTGVQELSLIWTSEGANGWKDWGRFATIFDGLLLAASG